MHTNDASYEAVLGGIDSPALIVSTKYTLGDFYSWLPLNVTLEQGAAAADRRVPEPPRVRELRRLPERSGARVPVRAAEAPRREREHRGHLDLDAGRRAVARRADDAVPEGRVLAAVRAQHDARRRPRARPRQPTSAASPRTGRGSGSRTTRRPSRRSSQAMSLSRPAIEQGMYIEPFAEQRVFAIGLEPPPMMWIFEWDILTGDSAVLDVIYAISRDATGGDIEQAIAGGDQALADVESMRELVASTDAATWRDASRARRVPRHDGLRGRRAAAARVVPGDDPAPGAVARHAVAGRVRRLGGRSRRVSRRSPPRTSRSTRATSTTPRTTSRPPSSACERADRDLAMAWIARGLLLAGRALGRDRRARIAHPARPPPGCRRRASRVARARPGRGARASRRSGCCRSDRWLLLGIPAALLVATRAVQTSFLSWTHLAVVLGAWLVFLARGAAAACAGGRRGRSSPRSAGSSCCAAS